MFYGSIFVDGSTIDAKGTSGVFPNDTQVIALTAALCTSLEIDVYVVVNESQTLGTNGDYLHNVGNSQGFDIPASCFRSVKAIGKKQLPVAVSAVTLPALLKASGTYVTCGLCHIMRAMVKEAMKTAPHLSNLLGYKQCCLKCSSEMSPKTYLCEITASHFLDHVIPVINDCSILPSFLEKFEALLKKPVSIHNKDKHQRVILNLLQQENNNNKVEAEPEGTRKPRTIVKTNDLPDLGHVFADGITLTLADIALLPSIHAYLQACHNSDVKFVPHKSTPEIVKWYKRVQDVPGLIKSVKLCSVTFISTDCQESTQSSLVLNHNMVLSSKNDQFVILEHTDHKPVQVPKVDKEDHQAASHLTIRKDLKTVLNKVKCTMDFSMYENVKLRWTDLPSDTHPTSGELASIRAMRKCQQIENFVEAAKSVCKDGDTIVEFCCGGGHVGIVLAFLMPSCKVVLLDNKEESLDRAKRRVEGLNLSNVTIYQCNLEHYSGKFDLGIALHACGVATDMVLKKCLQHDASFIVSPCCYGKIKNVHGITYPQSTLFQTIPLSEAELILLGQASDQTSWNFSGEKGKTGKQCMGYVDLDRIMHAPKDKFHTLILTMNPYNCTPKNNLLVGFSHA